MRTDLDTILTPGAHDESPRLAEAGTVTKVDGTEGRVLVRLKPESAVDALDDEFLLVKVNGGIAPMRVTGVTRRGDRSATVTLANIRTTAQAQTLVGCKVFAKSEGGDYGGDDDYERDSLIGFTIVDTEIGEVGTIEDVDDSVSVNPLFVVETPTGQTLIPAAKEFIVGIDEDAKALTMTLPDGLLNLGDAPEA